MSKNALGFFLRIKYDFLNLGIVAKVLNMSKLLSRIPIDLGMARTDYGLYELVKVFTN